MEIKKIVTGDLEENCYLVWDKAKNRGVVIDPGDDPEAILAGIGDVKVDYVFLTHTHFDHVLGLESVVKATKAQVVVHEGESEMVRKGKFNPPQSKYLTGKKKAPMIKEVVKVKGGEEFTVGELKIKVLATPGHTPGGMSIKVGKVLFTGDTIFASSIGRTDLWGGDHQTLLDSIEAVIFRLPDNVKIYPGHGEMSSVGQRKRDSESGGLY